MKQHRLTLTKDVLQVWLLGLVERDAAGGGLKNEAVEGLGDLIRDDVRVRREKREGECVAVAVKLRDHGVLAEHERLDQLGLHLQCQLGGAVEAEEKVADRFAQTLRDEQVDAAHHWLVSASASEESGLQKRDSKFLKGKQN
jgi:hypothetical protein